MQETITIDGRQFTLSYDTPMTEEQRAQTIAQIRSQTGCSSCRQPNTMSTEGFGNIYGLADTCVTSTKSSGDTITMSASPNGAVGPYYVRFWRMPATGATNALSWSELGTTRTVTEGSTTSTSFTLYDTDLVAASGNGTAGTPVCSATTLGLLVDPGLSGAPLDTGRIRVATTVYDSCPTGGQCCLSWCDISLGCVAPTCNFTVI
jgi:hypothetical protein